MKNFTKGFTLIELLVVIAIIGILAAIVMASLGSARDKGSDASVISTMGSLRTQGELYYHNNSGTYGTTAGTCDTGLFNATTPGGLDTIIEDLKEKVTSANLSCRASSTAWVVAAFLKGPGTYCVDSRGAGTSSTTAANATAALNANTGTCR